MDTENVSFQDALFIIKNHIVNKSSSFSDIVSKPKFNTVRESSNASITVSNGTFHNLSQFYGSIKNSNTNNNKFAHKRNNRTSELINLLAQDNV